MALLVLPVPGFASPEPKPACTEGHFRYLQFDESVDPRDSSMACRSLDKALGFFREFDLPVARHKPVEVYFSGEPILQPYGELSFEVAGRYDPAINQLHMSSSADGAAWLAGTTPYLGIPRSMDLLNSVMMHEFVHILSDGNYTYDVDSYAGDEYIAYSAQLYAMEDAPRNAILGLKNDSTFVGAERAISNIYLSMSPDGFAASAYRHFMSPSGGAEFIKKIWSGGFRPTIPE